MKNFSKYFFLMCILFLSFSCKKDAKPGSSIKSEIDNVIYGNPIKIEITIPIL